jgi:branched-chain amino acid transport system substrate-binding protein
MSVRNFQKWQAGTVAVVLTAGMMVAGCGNGGTNNTSNGTSPASNGGKPIKVGVVTSLTGPIAEYGVEWRRGFNIGLAYATNGTNAVNGRKVEVTFKDDGGDANTAVKDAKDFFQTDKVDILAGAASSASAIAMEPIAERFKSVFMVGPAVADSITGKNYNPYVFKVSPNSFMEAKAAVASIQGSGVTVAQLAPNYAFGWDSVKAFKQLAEGAGMKDVTDVYADVKATDFTPQLEKIVQAHPKYLFVTWAGAPGPWKAIEDMKLQQQGITVVTGIPNIAAIQALFKGFSGMQGFTTYYYTLPNNDANTYLVQHDKSDYNTVPDLFDPDGMAAAIALVEGLKKTGGDPTGDKLSAVLAGMTFQGPKGSYTFRTEDHQALQDQFGVVLKDVPGVDYPVPTLTKVLSAQDTVPPILNK